MPENESINEQINRIKTNIADAYAACEEKSAEMPLSLNSDSLAETIRTISTNNGGEVVDTPIVDWQPNPEWWDIKKIIEEDTRDYAGKFIALYYDVDVTTPFSVQSDGTDGCQAIATSDGAFYNTMGTKNHTWDTSKDKKCSDGTATRYVIYYYNTENISRIPNEQGDASAIYMVFKCNITSSADIAWFQRKEQLQSFDFCNGYKMSGTSFKNFCRGCNSLQRIPDSVDFSQCTDFSYFCYECYSLVKLPDNLDTSKGTMFTNFCYECYSLVKLPDNLDTSSGTNFTSFCVVCCSLVKLPDNLDTSKGTDFTSFCGACDSLVYAKIKIGTKSITSLNGSTQLSYDSLKYIADNAPTVTDNPTLTLGSKNIARAGGADGEIIKTLTDKGWTVN